MEKQPKKTVVSKSDIMVMAAIIRAGLEISAQIGVGGYPDPDEKAVKIAKSLCKIIDNGA